MSTRDGHLALLGLPTGASAREIRRAFRRLVLELHPDRRGGDPRAAARLRGVVDAYEELTSSPRRARPRRRPAPASPVRTERGPLVCPRCEDSYGAPGDCPRCGIAVGPIGRAAARPPEPEVDAMLARLETSASGPDLESFAPRVPAAAISSLLVFGAAALPIHAPIATMLVGYALLLFAGEAFARNA